LFTRMIIERLEILERKVAKIMSTETDLETVLATIKADIATYQGAVASQFSSLHAQLTALQTQAAAGSPVSQAQLDALVASAQAVDAQIKAAPTA